MTLLTRPFSLRGALWMSAGDDVVVDPQRIALLVKIDELGSISRAAKVMGWGYESAWDAVETMNVLAGSPLVAKPSEDVEVAARGSRIKANDWSERFA